MLTINKNDLLFIDFQAEAEGMTSDKYPDTSLKNQWIKTVFTSKFPVEGGETTLFEQVLSRIRPVKMKLRLNLEEIHGIGRVVIDVQAAACEVMINLLIAYPGMFYDAAHEDECKQIVDVILKALKNQSFNSRIVETGLRFLGLYAKNYPQLLRKVLEENKAIDSFLELVESVRDQEFIAHCITIISAIYTNADYSEEDNERVCKILMHYLQSNNLRVICESLNALFDIYSEETYDKVLAKLNLVPTLEGGQDALFLKLNNENRNYDEEEIEFFEETLLNLEEFCKYKRSHM